MKVRPKKIIYGQGIIEWVDENDLAHSESTPALIWFDGSTVWLRHGEERGPSLSPTPAEWTRESVRMLFNMFTFLREGPETETTNPGEEL